MRRFTLASAAAAVALTVVIPTSVLAGTDERGTPTDVIAEPHLEVLRLECAVRRTDHGVAVGCAWSAPSSPPAAGIKLFRLDPATDPHRQVIFRTRDLDVTHHTDTEVRRGHRYAYSVQAVDEQGRVVGQSRAEWVEVPGDHDVEVLRLDCALGPAHEAIGCEWSRPQSRDAHVVTLWRSVDDGPREMVERFRPSGPHAYRDPVPAGATEVTYAVIATSERDRVVARSRPETVRIPRRVDPTPIDPVRDDAATLPADTAPSAQQPSSAVVLPTDVVPVDIARAQPAGEPAPARLSPALRARILRLIRELTAL